MKMTASEKINQRIKVYDELEKKARDRGNINSTMMYFNIKIGLLESLEILSGSEVWNDKQPLLISVDGVQLFEGDEYWCVIKLNTGWGLLDENRSNSIMEISLVVTEAEVYKAFFVKENALAWIADQNKPKEVEVKLFGLENKATISKDRIRITNSGFTICITPSDIEDISHALKTLTNNR